MSSSDVKKLKEENEELKSKLLRALADYDNLLKRTQSEKEQVVQRANLQLVKELLPLLDLVKKAQANLKDPALALVEKNFEELVLKVGLEKIDDIGVEFDPTVHEVVSVLPGKEDNKVAEVLSPGYKFGDWVLRPASVRVYKKDDKS